MKVSELNTSLSYGELSNLAISGEGAGTILDPGKPKIIRAANEALLRLHARFILIERDLILETFDHITNYHLSSKFARSTYDPNKVKYPYILDLHREPFNDDVIKVLSVYSQYGHSVPLNNDSDPLSIFTPQPLILQIPRARTGYSLSVLYQAKHPTLVDGDDTQEIDLPDSLKGAFTAFIAYKIFTNMGTQESTAKAAEHQAMYEAICKEVESMDLVNSSISNTSTRFHKNGWS